MHFWNYVSTYILYTSILIASNKKNPLKNMFLNNNVHCAI